MGKQTKSIALPDEVVMQRIYLVRNVKVMLDRDLANLYGVETKVLKQSVKRNISRFPGDFMFEMSKSEFESWRNEFVTTADDKQGLRYAPFCFTEQGVAMLSSILKSERAIQVNIQIIRIFTKMRQLLSTQKDILVKLEQLERKDLEQDDKIMIIFEYLKQLEKAKQEELEQRNRPRIGFKPTRK
ncbi:MAG: ORF6N domain-containing protein [Bacteroidales bacterium]